MARCWCVLLAQKRGKPRVCPLAGTITPEEEDRDRVSRERKSLKVERIRNVNGINGPLFGQVVKGYEPRRQDRRNWMDELAIGDGHLHPAQLKAQINHELDRVEFVIQQIETFEETRDVLLAGARLRSRSVQTTTWSLQSRYHQHSRCSQFRCS